MNTCPDGHRKLGRIGASLLRGMIWTIENVVAREHRVIVFTPCYIAAELAQQAQYQALAESRQHIAQGGQYL